MDIGKLVTASMFSMYVVYNSTQFGDDTLTIEIVWEP